MRDAGPVSRFRELQQNVARAVPLARGSCTAPASRLVTDACAQRPGGRHREDGRVLSSAEPANLLPESPPQEHTAPAQTTLWVIDWDADAAAEVRSRLQRLGAAWQVINCPMDPLHAGQGRSWSARSRLWMRYLATAIKAAWRSRGADQTVVWQQLIGYLMCVLPRWPAWACTSGQSPRLIITTVLLSPAHGARRGLGAAVLGLALRRADGLVYFSREMALETARQHPRFAHKVFWMPLPQFAEPEGQTAPRSLASAQASAQHLKVFTGGSSDRDFDVVIEAFRDPPVPLVLVCREDQRLPATQALGSHVDVRRGVSEAEYHALAASADVAVVALKSASSGCGQLLVDHCMRHGVAVIATDCCGTRDLVEHGHTGCLVPPGDARALRLAYDALAADPAYRMRMVLAARKRRESTAPGLAGFVQALHRLKERRPVAAPGGLA